MDASSFYNRKKDIKFRKPVYAHQQYSIGGYGNKRPNFKAESVTVNEKPVMQRIKNYRRGIGNYTLQRPGFEQPPVQPRLKYSQFAKYQLEAISEIKDIQKDKTDLKYKARVRILDPTDYLWLREKERLKRVYERRFAVLGLSPTELEAEIEKELSINKPLGRDQRTILKETKNIVNSSLDPLTKMKEILDEVKQGKASSLTDRQTMIQSLQKILNFESALDNISQSMALFYNQNFNTLQVPTDYKTFGLPRFIDRNFLTTDDNRGKVNLLLLSKVRQGDPNIPNYDYANFVKDYTDPAGPKAIKGYEFNKRLIEMRGPALFVGDSYMDLEEGALITPDMLTNAYNDRNIPRNEFDGVTSTFTPPTQPPTKAPPPPPPTKAPPTKIPKPTKSPTKKPVKGSGYYDYTDPDEYTLAELLEMHRYKK